MPKHSEKRRMPYSADEMFALIADVERYKEFLPWCEGVRVRARTPGDAPRTEVLEADLIISFKVFRERFGSRVILDPDAKVIDVAYLDGPFRYLNNHWRFNEVAPGVCEVDFFVDFEFKNAVLRAVVGVVFGEAMLRIVRAFETRAAALYGPRTL